jgi:hypothetical protein
MAAALTTAPHAAPGIDADLWEWREMIASPLPDLRCGRCGSTHWDLAHPNDPDDVVAIA